jgi:nitric oxide reductase activation protein
MSALGLFMESLERLGIDFNALGFSESLYVYKPFKNNLSDTRRLSVDQKNELVESMRASGGGSTHDTGAVKTALLGRHTGDPEKDFEGLVEQAGELRYLIVVSDGEGNGAGSEQRNMDALHAWAKRKGITLIGVGIGEGMKDIEKRYPWNILVESMDDLPAALAELMEKIIKKGMAEGVEISAADEVDIDGI